MLSKIRIHGAEEPSFTAGHISAVIQPGLKAIFHQDPIVQAATTVIIGWAVFINEL